MEDAVRILGILPYDGLRNALTRAAASRPEISLDAFTGNMEEALDIARFHERDGYDAVISRGASARLLQSSLSIPVVPIAVSSYDILRAIRLAENYPYRYAVIGSPEITRPARILCDLLQKELEIATIYHEEDISPILRDLKQRGFSAVVCGTLAEDCARQLGLSSIRVLSGDECIETALDQAAALGRGYSLMRRKKTLCESVLAQEKEKLLLLDNQGNLCLSTLGENEQGLARRLRRELAQMGSGGIKTVVPVKTRLCEVRGEWIESDGRPYGLFRVSSDKLPAPSGRQGLFFIGRAQAEAAYRTSFFGASGALAPLDGKISELAKSALPIMITGEEGCGHDWIAACLYIHSPLCSNPLVTIDCATVNDKTWNYLMTNPDSPLTESRQTYYFKNLELLSPRWQKQLQSLLQERPLSRYGKLLASCVLERDRALPASLKGLISLFSWFQFPLTPLRRRLDELPMLAGLYTARKNTELSRELLGFEPEALRLLSECSWPGNYIQLARVLDRLIMITQPPYVSEAQTRRVLADEQSLLDDAKSESTFNLDRPLEEITRDIIDYHLKQTGGNQAAAARKLGISRTTLWRFLKK